MNIISWNCRGAGSKAFPSIIRDLRQEYDANFFILLETHVSGPRGKQIRDKMGFDKSFVVDAMGHSGGIWCLWDSAVWNVDVVDQDRQYIHLKGICSSWENVQANCIWRVGDGSLIRFWDHYWIPDVGNLSATVNQVSNITNSSDMLTDFLDVSGQWDIRKLQEVLPEDVVKRIATISPPSPWKEADHIAWGLSSDGQFSIKTAYQNLRDTQATPNKIFQLVWTWKGPERVRTFLWLVIHNAILTNVERSRRHLTTDNACPRCRQHEESILHLLRDCSYARRVWQRLIPANGIHSFFNTSLHDWLILNLTANSYWSCLFGVAISSLWFFRNKLVFKGEIVDAASGSYQIQARTKEFLKVATSNLKPKNNQDTSGSIIRWVRPNGEYIKLNVDGSWFAHRSNAACGGVFRDSAGRYLIGFAGNLGNCSIMHAELWAIVHGLTIAITHGYQNLMVESDSVAAINFIKNGSSSGHHCAPLIQDVRVLTERLKKVSWIHVFREANTVADQLAKKGHDLPLGLHIFDSSPPDISYALLCDCIGTVRLRGS
ncbi:hypothetical protein Ahy_A02g006258 [Arachis hypogaea]|uniref:Uncharacterized protein n=1 Tax=Arachis hypogaea TaxID=3818 RepID=A0A445E9T0_ARAHY|nr:hypothetical protein Ahy_A02g006258 [Arachis hypogaea]